MKRLSYAKAVRLSKLYDELLAAIPALRPVPPADPDPLFPDALVPVMALEASTGEVRIDVPDAVTDAAVAAVVNAHDATPPTPPPVPDYGADLQTPAEFAQQAATAVANLRGYIGLVSPTNAQTLAVVKLLCRIAIFYIRRQFA